MEDAMKRTNIELDDKKIEELKKITGLKTSKAIIDYALNELLRKSNQHKILGLKGKIKWEGDLEHIRLARGVQ
jgi:Arc/MetJ family transcription regulator